MFLPILMCDATTWLGSQVLIKETKISPLATTISLSMGFRLFLAEAPSPLKFQTSKETGTAMILLSNFRSFKTLRALLHRLFIYTRSKFQWEQTSAMLQEGILFNIHHGASPTAEWSTKFSASPWPTITLELQASHTSSCKLTKQLFLISAEAIILHAALTFAPSSMHPYNTLSCIHLRLSGLLPLSPSLELWLRPMLTLSLSTPALIHRLQPEREAISRSLLIPIRWQTAVISFPLLKLFPPSIPTQIVSTLFLGPFSTSSRLSVETLTS